MEKWNDGEMKLTVYDLTNIKNDIRKYLISESDIYVDGDKLYDVVIEIEDYKSERDTLIDDNAKLRKERDDLKRKLDDVVELFNTHLYHKKAWSDNPYYDIVQRKLNQILDGYPVETTRLKRMYSTEIEQALKYENLEECLFLLEKIQMDLEEDTNND